ncbi:MAG: hypothetical protein N2558_02935 [Patescibacteria group bacterium]|nr:hypothetical protein [Patescibacteria group bacterium]
MPERFKINRPNRSLPGVYFGNEWLLQESEIDLAIVSGLVVALRIADQPPYGILFRVDDYSLVSKVWTLKGRIDKNGVIDPKYKPVTALSNYQLDMHIDWNRLDNMKFSRGQIDELLDLGFHTILPLKYTSNIPNHLRSIGSNGENISTMRFKKGGEMHALVEKIANLDANAIVGGTSLNKTGQTVYMDSAQVLSDFGGIGSVIDLFVVSELNNEVRLDFGAFHPMIEVCFSGIKVIRKGINFESLISYCRVNNLKVYES